MINLLRPYTEMKPSGLPWLGDLPVHWETPRSGTIFREVGQTGYPDLELLSIKAGIGIVRQSSTGRRVRASDDRSLYKRISPGWLGYNLMNAFFGGIGISSYEGILSPAYAVARPKFEIYGKYFQYLYLSPIYLTQFNRESYGIMYERNRLYFDRFQLIQALLPPLDEQRLIVRFLDWHGAQTAKLIRKKQGLLRLVAEEREALTQEVVSSPRTKQMRLENVADYIFRSINRESGSTYTPVGLFNRGRGIFRKLPASGYELGDSTFSWIEEGDLILSGQFAWEGAVALAGANEAGCIASHRYHILRGKADIVQTIYLSSFLRTSLGDLLLNEHSRGAAGRNRPLNIRTLLKEKIPVPPLNEQARLVELVTLERQLQASIGRFTEHLREFRTRLIADVVTGKLDVRAAAGSLPEVTDSGTIDDLVEIGDLDESIEDCELDEVTAS